MNVLATLAALAFPLECGTPGTPLAKAVAREVEVSPEKVGAHAFRILADGVPLAAAALEGKAPGSMAIRFTPPPGARSVVCEAVGGEMALGDAGGVDNLFSGALLPENAGRWELSPSVRMESGSGGVLLRADEAAPAVATARYTVEIPEALAGMPAKQEFRVVNRSRLAWGGRLHVEQLGGDGRVLPETLSDTRWTLHARPPGLLCPYRDDGLIHPKARALRFVAELRRLDARFDEYGLPLADAADALPALEIDCIAVRAARSVPFPKWNDSFFGQGVSGRPGDFSFKFGGPWRHSLFYQTRSRAAWTQRHPFRREDETFFPSGAGTVEAWFKPDWDAFAAARGDGPRKERDTPATLFEAWQPDDTERMEKGRGAVLQLACDATGRGMSLMLKDWKGMVFSKRLPEATLPGGVWSHVALQWEPGGTAEVFVRGRSVGTMPIPGFAAMPIGDPALPNPNDAWAVEFFAGAGCAAARLSGSPPEKADGVFFEGEGDLLRVSSGLRYDGAFAPDAEYGCDARTRAFFSFDRAFDGVSGGGTGVVPASVRADADRIDHVLRATGGEAIRYFPEANASANDPFAVLDRNNYPQVPTDADFRESRTRKVRTFELAAGDEVSVEAGPRAFPDFVEYANLSATEPLRFPVLARKDLPDPRSYGDMADSLAVSASSDCARSPHGRVEAVFQYAMRASDYFGGCHEADFPPGEDAPVAATSRPMTLLNSYCGFECGPLNGMVATLFATVAGCPAGLAAGYAHQFQQVFHDGKNHLYDLSTQRFFPSADNETAASLGEMEDQPGIAQRVSEDPDHFIRRGTRGSWLKNPDYPAKFAATLNPGEKLLVRYANDGKSNNLWTRSKSGPYGLAALLPGQKDYAAAAGADDGERWVYRCDRVFPHGSAATLSFDGRPTANNPAFCHFTPTSFAYRVEFPWPIVRAEYAAILDGGAPAPLDISTDRGATWRPLPFGGDGHATLEWLVKARHEYLVRVRAPVGDVVRFAAKTEGVVNPRVYPGWVRGGENEFAFKAEPGGRARVTLGWREPAREIVFDGAVSSGAIPGFERALVLLDPTRPLELGVSGLSAGAGIVSRGKISAALRGDVLRLAYDASRPPAIKTADDCPSARGEFPAVAAVDVVDGDAVKTLTVLVSPDARLIHTGGRPFDGPETFRFQPLPPGRYQVFALGRSFNGPKPGGFDIVDPASPETRRPLWRPVNDFIDYLKAGFGPEGQWSRRKWDSAVRRDLPPRAGWLLRAFAFQAGADSLDVVRAGGTGDYPPQLDALLVLPEPDENASLDLRNILFGLNCDPFHD